MFMRILGIVRFMVKLGRVDIVTEASQLLLPVAVPREGHLAHILHVVLLNREYTPGVDPGSNVCRD